MKASPSCPRRPGLSQHLLLRPIGSSECSPGVQKVYRGAASRAEIDKSDFVSCRQPEWYEKMTYRATVGQKTEPRMVPSQSVACYTPCQSHVILLNEFFSSFHWYVACGHQRSSGLQEAKCERKELVAVCRQPHTSPLRPTYEVLDWAQ